MIFLVSRIANELYRLHTSNKKYYPMYFINLKIPTIMYDINLTPDKRKIFLLDEDLVLKVIRVSFALNFIYK